MEKPEHVDNLFVFEAGSQNTIIKEQHVTVQSGANFFNGSHWQDDEPAETGEVVGRASPLEKELLPLFMNSLSVVQDFISAIDGQKPTAVTEQVNKFQSRGEILKANSKGKLWTIIHSYGLYKPSESTWNRQVN